ncbi:RecX family transcriptional regulator [Niastella vici]|uniref:Regulatory protein RecX n=1 Tax=Niastella vici TaxID=1703345 RepID=A0A1V9G9Q1_9BACT|nr:regulatory protein RecX [Niastella vici]OQP67290.1 RecX family transcriptional regulator [Niastella vici]
MIQRKQLTKEQALQKLRHYCAYQERSHVEVKEKLYSFGLRRQMVEESIAQLIEEDYLNEERFAIQFAGGKFRMKQWGRVKIIHALKQKQVSTYCINKAIKEIDADAYEKTLDKLAKQKWGTIKGEGVNGFVKMAKTTDYLLQKGFEPELVRGVVARLKEMKNEEHT